VEQHDGLAFAALEPSERRRGLRRSIDLAASVHVGDSDTDREAAAAAGIGAFVWARDFFGWAM
jgi:histidinol phosphatase-like enzyme